MGPWAPAEPVVLLARAVALGLGGYAVLWLLGAGCALVCLPRRWLRFWPVAAPHLGWAALVALGYPLNAAVPFRQALAALVIAATAIVVAWIARSPRRALAAARRPSPWREFAAPAVLAALTYLVGATVYARQGALSAVVVDSDVEHFADVVAALVASPVGWSAASQRGLEATPVGLAYHYVPALLSVVAGLDTFSTAIPSHLLLLSLAAQSVYLFARVVAGLDRQHATLATALYALGGTPLVVASFGWGQQTAAMAAVPFGLAAVATALASRDHRALWCAGLAAALAAGSLYLATAPLVTGSAVTIALVAVGRERAGAGRAAARLAAIGAVALAAGALSHLSAAAFLLARARAGLLRADELAGRSQHVSTFASAPAVLGVQPLDLYLAVATVDGRWLLRWPSEPLSALAWPSLAAGALLAGLGLVWAARSRPALLGVLCVVGAFAVYLRWVRPFPYGEFKLLTSAWFLAPCLASAGVRGVVAGIATPPAGREAPCLASAGVRGVGALHPNRRARRRAALSAAACAVLVYAAGLVAVQTHAVRFLALPWGAALPERAMQHARVVAAAVPPGASVWVSAQLMPEGAASWDGPPTAHRAGFESDAARANYLSKRWRGVLTSLLAFGGRPVYGLLQRHSSELRSLASPYATDFLLLDAAEDPRLYGALPADLRRAAGPLRLYRRVARPVATAAELAPGRDGSDIVHLRVAAGRLLALREGDAVAVDAGLAAPPLPPALLPVGESLPGRRGAAEDGSMHVVNQDAAAGALPAEQRTVVPGRPLQARAAPAGRREAPASRGNVMIGLQAIAATRIEITVDDDAGTNVRRALLLGPGLTWYTTPPVAWPAELRIRPHRAGAAPADHEVVPVAAFVVSGDGAPLPEDEDRSPSGADVPLLTLLARDAPEPDRLTLEAWYSFAGGREGPWRVELRDGPRLWAGGDSIPTSLSARPGGRYWRADFVAGAVPRQWASDGEPVSRPVRWTPADGPQWLWLNVGPYDAPALHEPAWRPLHNAAGRLALGPPAMSTVALPLLGGESPPLVPDDGWLVRGSGDDLFYVQGSRLRWVPDLDVLSRRGIAGRIATLDDRALWRLPAGLPLE